MRSLFLLSLLGIYVSGGLIAPFIFGLGYVWADLFTPQLVGYGLIAELPVSMILAGGTVAAYVLFDRRSPPRPVLSMLLLVAWAGWVTLTTGWAVVGQDAWVKWDWAFKTILMGAFLPFLFRSRIQIEAMMATVVLAVAGTMIAFGAKTLLGGGGYGMNLGLLSGNQGLAEGSTLAVVCAALVPIMLYLRRSSRLLRSLPFVKPAMIGLIAAAILTAIGTQARAGLVSLAVLALILLMQTRRKLLYAGIIAVSASLGWVAAPEAWHERMSTIGEYNSESSALGRVAVWLWTLEFVQGHPLGGGFDAYKINSLQVPIEDQPGEYLEIQGKAFHSIYFEVLGEHGIPGAVLFAALLGSMLLSLLSVIRRTKGNAELAWLRDMAQTIVTAVTVYLVGGAFIGIAFQPMLYYFVAWSICMAEYLRRYHSERAAEARVAARPARRGRRTAAVAQPG